MATGHERGVCVFAPAPILTLTIERTADDDEELHVHPGGQGYWVARMVGLLGAPVVVCCPLGGETGEVLEHLLGSDRVELRAVPARRRAARTSTIGARASAMNGGARASDRSVGTRWMTSSPRPSPLRSSEECAC